MAKRKGLSRPTKIFWGLLAVVLIAITGIWGYNRYMQKKKVEQLYQHGFRLLEEQIATYIKENYSGVSKIEFSPIFISGGGQHSFLNLDVVPVVYDEYGNKAYLGKSIEKQGYGSYGTGDSLRLAFDSAGEEVIELKDFDADKVYDVSGYKTLPDFAKLKSNPLMDKNVAALVENHQLEAVEKSSEGSPGIEIVYNLEIRKGDYTQWP
ncbi:hypothetical protein [Streptococcus pantholopis]|uniref:Uncharacterized protein n=1 Tax=Streptococcus pantholopis TaxID=1811193 RepID=A0A172Q664_9STRE|nr:hypothetical protein [Streptococcus pantholopis]AND78946.1 hypothetical protein A0O21_02385 [Streptococcus pantholopis]